MDNAYKHIQLIPIESRDHIQSTRISPWARIQGPQQIDTTAHAQHVAIDDDATIGSTHVKLVSAPIRMTTRKFQYALVAKIDDHAATWTTVTNTVNASGRPHHDVRHTSDDAEANRMNHANLSMRNPLLAFRQTLMVANLVRKGKIEFDRPITNWPDDFRKKKRVLTKCVDRLPAVGGRKTVGLSPADQVHQEAAVIQFQFLAPMTMTSSEIVQMRGVKRLTRLTPVVGATFQMDAFDPPARQFHRRPNHIDKDEDRIASNATGARTVTPATTRSAPTIGAISTSDVWSGSSVLTGSRPFDNHCASCTSAGGTLRRRL